MVSQARSDGGRFGRQAGWDLVANGLRGWVGNQEEFQSPSLHTGTDGGAVCSLDNRGGGGGGKMRCPLCPCLVPVRDS